RARLPRDGRGRLRAGGQELPGQPPVRARAGPPARLGYRPGPQDPTCRCPRRLLRDSTALVGSSYVEFDLEAIFDGELFSDFVLLYLTCHESRFAIQGDGGPASCYLEQWRGFAAQQGERALDQLRKGVQQAIAILGTGFLSHPANPHLRGRLDPGSADLKLDDL